MEIERIRGEKWHMGRVALYVAQVEVAYSVSLKFWVEFVGHSDGPASSYICAWGSGTIFDLLPPRIQVAKQEIIDEESHAVGEALYHATKYLELAFNSIREPIGARPSL